MFETAIQWFKGTFDFSAAIASLSLALSVGQIAFSLLRGRESYRLDVVDYKKSGPDIVQLLVVIENRSKSPLTISEIRCMQVPCELEPKRIRSTYLPDQFQMTASFALCIAPRSCNYYYLEFVDISFSNFPNIELCRGTVLNLEILSTRSRARKDSVLRDQSHYLHTIQQHRRAVLGD